MNISSQSLLDALEQVRSGKLSPQQAAQWLLEGPPGGESLPWSSRTPTTVSMAQLVAELGPPHPLIQQDWEEQIQQLTAQFHHATGTLLRQLHTSDLLVDPSNRLSLAPSFLNRWAMNRVDEHPTIEHANWTPRDTPPVVPDIALASERVSATVSDGKQESEKATDVKPQSALFVEHSASSGHAGPLVTKPNSRVDLADKPKRRPHRFSRSWKAIAAATAALTIMLLSILWLTRSSDTESVAKASKAPQPTPPSATNAFDFAAGAPKESETSGRSDELEWFESGLNEPSANDQSSTANSQMEEVVPHGIAGESEMVDSSQASTKPPIERGMLGLNSFAGGNWQSATDVLKAASGDNEVDAQTDELATDPSDADPLDAQVLSAEEADANLVREDAETDETELTTSVQPTVDQVTLPALVRRNATEESELLALPLSVPVRAMELQIPFDSPLEMHSEGDQWLVTANEVALARIFTRDQQLQFQWLDEAYHESAAKQLCNSRIIGNVDDTAGHSSRDLFLRTTVTAEPLQIDFGHADQKVAWDIHDVPVLAKARWQNEWIISNKVIQQWSEPLSEDVRRRQSAVCRFHLVSDEAIAIDSRFDWQVGTRIQLRMRHQLASDNPMVRQPISLTQVRTAIDFCTEQLSQGELSLEQLKIGYSRARTTDRPLISEQRHQLEEMMDNWQRYRDRLKQYDKLLSELQKRCYLAASLQVVWDEAPAKSQVIFAVKAPPPSPIATESSKQPDQVKREIEKPLDGEKKSKPPTM